MDCLFCAIVDKTIPADIVFEDEKVVAFRDITPQAPSHLLVIPKVHIATLNDMTAADCELLGHMVYTAKTIAKEEGIADNGFRLAMNCKEDGGQTVYHIHMHLLGGRSMSWPPG